jgi:hypothetical protein
MEERAFNRLRDWLWQLDRNVELPPLCLEIVLRDATRYYLRAVMDEHTRSMVLRIWDLRALSPSDQDQLLRSVNDMVKRGTTPATPQELHSNLDQANLRVQLDDVWYCIEWHNRYWPEEARKRIGFAPPQ